MEILPALSESRSRWRQAGPGPLAERGRGDGRLHSQDGYESRDGRQSARWQGRQAEARGEGWIVNPSYHATTLPYYCRFLQHFDLPHPEDAYRDAVLRYADYSLDLLGGKPLDFDKLRKPYTSHWPSRFVAVIPLMLAAHDIKPDPRYARAATLMFDVLMEMVERNPQGYWSAWAAQPQRREPFDTVYNGAGCQRGPARLLGRRQVKPDRPRAGVAVRRRPGSLSRVQRPVA